MPALCHSIVGTQPDMNQGYHFNRPDRTAEALIPGLASGALNGVSLIYGGERDDSVK